MNDFGPPSEGSDSLSELRPAPLNFSRPRPVSVNSKQKLFHDDNGRPSNASKGIGAFYDPNRNMPAEPRFSSESVSTDRTNSTNSAASEFAWDGQAGELRSKRRPDVYERDQRFSKTSSSNSSGGSNRTATGSDQPILRAPTSMPPSILRKSSKIVVPDQGSDQLSISSRGEWEDNGSHHTVSVEGEEGFSPVEGKWSSSDHDTSGLSQSELKKLRKKGINPALYAEMKAARKGKGKWVGPLVGNSFL